MLCARVCDYPTGAPSKNPNIFARFSRACLAETHQLVLKLSFEHFQADRSPRAARPWAEEGQSSASVWVHFPGRVLEERDMLPWLVCPLHEEPRLRTPVPSGTSARAVIATGVFQRLAQPTNNMDRQSRHGTMPMSLTVAADCTRATTEYDGEIKPHEYSQANFVPSGSVCVFLPGDGICDQCIATGTSLFSLFGDARKNAGSKVSRGVAYPTVQTVAFILLRHVC